MQTHGGEAGGTGAELSPKSTKSDGEEVALSTRIFAASHDALTSMACVAYWAGMWGFLDALAVSEVASGCAATLLVILLAVTKADQLLEKCAAAVPMALQVLFVWLWTCFLAVLSLLVWRIGFFLVHKKLHPGNNVHAIAVAALGVAILVPGGRYRSASCAPPVGVVVDIYSPGLRFSAAAFSGHALASVFLDFVLTVPVVFTWAGVWMLMDNLEAPPVLFGLLCMGWISLCCIFSLSDLVRSCVAGIWPVSEVADFLWTSLKTVACIGVWRGAWETLFVQLGLSQAPQAAATFVVGAVGLTLLKRHRSACFPPVDFSIDDGDHFHSVGSVFSKDEEEGFAFSKDEEEGSVSEKEPLMSKEVNEELPS